jgi:hypothetical protein
MDDELRKRIPLLENLAVLNYEADGFKRTYILQWITGYGDDVRVFSRLERAEHVAMGKQASNRTRG